MGNRKYFFYFSWLRLVMFWFVDKNDLQIVIRSDISVLFGLSLFLKCFNLELIYKRRSLIKFIWKFLLYDLNQNLVVFVYVEVCEVYMYMYLSVCICFYFVQVSIKLILYVFVFEEYLERVILEILSLIWKIFLKIYVFLIYKYECLFVFLYLKYVID